VVTQEAIEQNKSLEHHLTHLWWHGLLHAVGLDHVIDEDAEFMESLEVQILKKLGITDPYRIID
jgi:probable rRNA maturation factor